MNTTATHRLRRSFVTALLTLVAAFSALGLTAAPAMAIVNGGDAPDSIAASIAVFVDSANDPYCTGTLVHPQWVLTAKHCVDPDVPGASFLRIGDDPYVHFGTAIRSAPYDNAFYNDVVLVHLDTPSLQPVLPVAAPADRATWEVAPGQDLYALAVGWGIADCSWYQTTPDGRTGCTAGTTPSAAQAASVRINPPDPSYTQAHRIIDVDAGTGLVCQGDSGSPLLVTAQGGRTAVAGVLSGATCTGGAFYVRVAEGVNHIWLNAQLRASQGTVDFDGDGAADVFTASPVASTTLGQGSAYQAAYSSRGESNWVSLGQYSAGVDDLRFGDFNGDGITDVFGVAARTGGGYQWRWSPSGTGSWLNLAWDYAPLEELRFGDFDGDGRTDVFHATPRAGGGYQWRYSPGGTGGYVDLAWDPANPAELRFGDFDGDGRTDVFHATPRARGGYQWRYVSGGSHYAWTPLAFAYEAPGELRFGDFEGDGVTDVFHATPNASGGYDWRYSDDGAASWRTLGTMPEAPADLRFGDFDDDGRTDVFTATPLPEGGSQWQYSRSGYSGWRPLAFAFETLPQLRVGELYGQS